MPDSLRDGLPLARLPSMGCEQTDDSSEKVMQTVQRETRALVGKKPNVSDIHQWAPTWISVNPLQDCEMSLATKRPLTCTLTLILCHVFQNDDHDTSV